MRTSMAAQRQPSQLRLDPTAALLLLCQQQHRVLHQELSDVSSAASAGISAIMLNCRIGYLA